MKGLSVLFTMALLLAAQLLAVQLRRARALPAQHPSHARVTQTAANHAAHPTAGPKTNSLD